MADTATTPWGTARVVEEVVIEQAAGERAFASLVQALELEHGERLVRFAYATAGSARRGPVTLRAEDLDVLRAELGTRPTLRRLLGRLRGGARTRARPPGVSRSG